MWQNLGAGRGAVWIDGDRNPPELAGPGWDVTLNGVLRVPHDAAGSPEQALEMVAGFQSRAPLFRDPNGVVLTELSVDRVDRWVEDGDPTTPSPADDDAFPNWDDVAQYAPRDERERFVVVFVAAYDVGDEVSGPHDAAASALSLMRDDGSPDTVFHVWDRLKRVLHRLEMSDFDPELESDEEFLRDLEARRRQRAPGLAEVVPLRRPGTKVVDEAAYSFHEVDGVDLEVRVTTWNGGGRSFDVVATDPDGAEVGLTEDESLDHAPDVDELRALLVRHFAKTDPDPTCE